MTTYIDMVGIVLVAIFLVLDWYFGFASQTGQMVSGPLPLSMEGHSSISLVTRSSECRRCREKIGAKWIDKIWIKDSKR